MSSNFELTETRLVHTDNATTNNFWTDVSLAAQILLPLAFLAVLLSKKIAVYPFQGYVTGFWPSVNQQQRLLKWLTDRIPYMSNTPKKISQYWKDGSLLCTLINTVVPGACPNPQKHWKKPPTHAQALAYKYLGIPPVLSSLDFAENLDKKSESKFISYLYTLQEAINKLSIDPSSLHFTNRYIARGMGLIIGEQNKMSTFYIYPNADTDKLENIFINIKGPYASFGKEVISASSMTKSMRKFMKERTESAREKKKLAFRGRSQRYLFRSLSFDLGPLMELWTKTKSGDITIKINIEPDRAKVEFLPTHSGVYELLLTTNGEHFRGSPFVIRVTKKLSELTETIAPANQVIKTKNGRRIISKTIDFIDETMDISENNVMFLKLDQNNNKTMKDNLRNEEIEYIEIAQKATMKEIIYNGEIGDNIANAKKDNKEKRFEKYVHKTLEEAERDIKETSGNIEELDLKKWADYQSSEDISEKSSLENIEEVPVEEKDSRELVLEGLNEELKIAQKKMEERFAIMEEKCGELETLKNNIVNHLHKHDHEEPEITKQEETNIEANLTQKFGESRKNEDSVVLQSFEIDPYSEEEREFERLYKESLYSNIKPEEEKSDSYPITDSESYIFENPVKEPKISSDEKNEVTTNEEEGPSEETVSLLEEEELEGDRNEVVDDSLSNKTGDDTTHEENLQIEEDNTFVTNPSEDYVTTSSIVDSNMTLKNDSDEVIEEEYFSVENRYANVVHTDSEDTDDEELLKKNKDITMLKEEDYPLQEFELNRVLVQKDSGYISSGSAKSIKSIKDIRDIFEKKSQMVINVDKSKTTLTKFLEPNREEENDCQRTQASPICDKNIEVEAQTNQTQDSAYPPLDNQLSLESLDEDNQVNVFEIRLKFENKIQQSNAPKKTYKKPIVKSKLSTTKSLPNLMAPYKFEDETPFLNSSDSLNEFVLQFKEKKEFWDRLVENSSCSSLNSSMSDVAYQNALKTRVDHRSELSQSHSCLYNGEFECIDEEKGEEVVAEDLPKDFHGSSTGVLDRIRVFEKDFDSQKCTTLLKKAKQKSQKSLSSLTNFNSIKNTQELADIPLTDQHVEENLYFAEEMKKRFESARTFFRSIETTSTPNPRSKLQRHFSCEDRETIENNLPKRSESMRNLNVFDRFSLDNLYRDVMLSKMQHNGSFRGSPNKHGVVDTLASMSSTESGLEKDFREDEDVDLKFFSAKRRTKHRKSIKSVFEVNY